MNISLGMVTESSRRPQFQSDFEKKNPIEIGFKVLLSLVLKTTIRQMVYIRDEKNQYFHPLESTLLY